MKNYVSVMLIVSSLFVKFTESVSVNKEVSLVIDMSTTCVDNLHSDVYLPYGMGASDASIVIISDNDLYSNCEVTFYMPGAKEEVILIIVVEFPDHSEGHRNACQDDGSTVMIKEPGRKAIDVCVEVNRLRFGYFATATYSIFSASSNVSAVLTSKSLFETVKITATSARKLSRYEQCYADKEITCVKDNTTVCISKELLCDKNINCGTPGLNDEDVRICDETKYNRLWLVVLVGTGIVIIIAFFLIHLLKTCLPAIPDNFFIFNEDEDNKLILTSRFTAPHEGRRQILLPTPPPLIQETSSFKFKDIPMKEIEPPLIPLPETDKTQLSNREEVLYLRDVETEINSLTYMDDLTSTEGSDLVKAPHPIREDQRRMPGKRPRFESNVNVIEAAERMRPSISAESPRIAQTRSRPQSSGLTKQPPTKPKKKNSPSSMPQSTRKKGPI